MVAAASLALLAALSAHGLVAPVAGPTRRGRGPLPATLADDDLASDAAPPASAAAAGPWDFRYADAPTRRRVAEAHMRARARRGGGAPLNVVLLGKPASGKGTIGAMLSVSYRVANVGVGALLRAQQRARTPLGEAASEMMARGELLPCELVSDVVAARLRDRDATTNGWMLDGFPRTPAQAEMMVSRGLTPDAVIVLDRPDALAAEFLLGRCADAATGAVYHPKFSPPPDDEAIRARLVWRVDDNEAVLRERLEAHQRTIDEILQVRAPLLARARGGDSRISP